jgi:hypothetical protein
MGWTKKHREFALKEELTLSAIYLWCWLADRQQEGVEQEIDLRKFNKWVAKHRKKGNYDRKTLKDALAQLEEVGLVKVLRTYTWNTQRLILYSPEYVTEEKSPEKNLSPNPKRSNPRQIESYQKTCIKQQQIRLVAQICQSVGIDYRPADLQYIAAYGVETVKKAVELLKVRSLTSKISNPPGWLRRCLQNSWWLDLNENEEHTLFGRVCEIYAQSRDWLIENYGTLPVQ